MNSMTGFGRAEITIGTQQISFEVKSVNHRFLDFRVRLPHACSSWEVPLCDKIKELFERGSFDIFVRTKTLTGSGVVSSTTLFALDERALKSFQNAFSKLSESISFSRSLDPSDIIRTGKIIIPVEDLESEALSFDQVLPAWELALKALLTMRVREGLTLKTTMEKALTEMESELSQIEQLAPLQKEKIKDKWNVRLAQWRLEPPVEPHRMEWEVALLTEKADITEEIDRFSIHVNAARDTLNSTRAVGRKLDFLIQEMHREVNTIASKAQLMEITQLTVKLRSHIEKLREQVQNVE